MNPQTDYQFVMIPQQLTSCLDANCGKMLSTLLGLSSLLAKEDGWFYRSNKELQLDTRFSQNLVIATLDTLYQAGIINVDCVGKGKGHRSNRIHINYDSFGVYQHYTFNEIRNNPDLWIDTVPYKNHYSPSYCKENGKKVTTNTDSTDTIGKEIGKRIGNTIGKKVTTNTDTTDTSNTTNTIENNIDNNIENMKINLIEDRDSFFEDNERNIVMIVEEEKKTKCTDEELKNIYLNSFGELLSNYPGLNYYLITTNNQDSFYECYRDIVNELLMKLRAASQRNISKEDMMGTLNNYLCYIHYQ